MRSPFLTLLTDFGTQDTYVGALKGVLYSICPQLQVVDLSHDIPPQDVAAARFQLMQAVPYFPIGSLHLAVVDPGVGSDRRAIAIETAIGILIGPDNGIWSGVLAQFPAQRVVSLTNSAFWRSTQLSTTFHGRDLFAPVAAHLARGVPLLDVGEAIDPASLQLGHWIKPQRTASGWLGQIQAIDRFGNLITNLPADLWTATGGITWDNRWLPCLRTYCDVPIGSLLVLRGSHGFLEIAVNQGSAQQILVIKIGDAVRLEQNRER